jgi:hypothetical protein
VCFVDHFHRSDDYPYVRRMSGQLSGMVFQRLARETTISSYNRERLGEIFHLTGELIAMADPLMDIEKDLRRNQYNPILDSVKKNNTSLFSEFNHLKSEYEQTEDILRAKLLSAEKEKVSNHAYFIVMDLCMNELKRKIIQAKDAAFQPNFPSKHSYPVGITNKRFPVKRFLLAGICDCCHGCDGGDCSHCDCCCEWCDCCTSCDCPGHKKTRG